jgi:hypothetical protein
MTQLAAKEMQSQALSASDLQLFADLDQGYQNVALSGSLVNH